MSTAESLRRTVTALLEQPMGAPAGCVVGVDIDGERTVASGGLASPELGDAPMRRETLHDLASVTKVVGTTTALQRLASEGQLEIDAPVTRYVPAYGGDAETTVRQVLQHRAGLWEWQPLYLAPNAHDPFTVVDALPLRYEPGSERHYSDLGFLTLGRVVAAIVDAPLDVAIRELVARPLGLSRLAYGPGIAAGRGAAAASLASAAATSAIGDAAERRMVATGEPYPVRWNDAGFAWRTDAIRGVANDGNCAHAFGGVAGHAGLFAPVDELLDVAAALSRADDDTHVWSPRTNADFIAAGPDSEQALGWRRRELTVDDRTMPLLWHPGFTGTAVGFVPGRGIAVAFASNRLLAADPQPTTAHWERVLDSLTSILSTQE